MFSWLTDQVAAAAAGQKALNLADYPPISLQDLAAQLVPTYIQKVPVHDGWGHAYEYRLNLADPLAKHVMCIRSPGRDGKLAGEVYEIGGFDPRAYDEDIVWCDGYFVRWPQAASAQ